MQKKLNAAIIGLGNVGLLFDEDKERKAAGEIGWTHFYAYQSLPDYYNLIAVVDQDKSKFDIIKNKNKEILFFENIDSLLSKNLPLDVISICTPNNTHIEYAQKFFNKTKGLFIEKPIDDISNEFDFNQLKEDIIKSNISIRVNYYKINEPAVQKAYKLIDKSKLKFLSLKYSGPLDAVGSHALSVLHLFANDIEIIKSIKYPSDERWGATAFFSTENNYFAQLTHCNERHNLIFELELIDDKYKIIIDKNFSRLKKYMYFKSERYSMNYKEIKLDEEIIYPPNTERFSTYLLEMYNEINENVYDYNNLDISINTQKILNKLLR